MPTEKVIKYDALSTAVGAANAAASGANAVKEAIQLAASTGVTYSVADTTALAAIASPTNGQTAFVRSNNGIYERVNGVWTLQTSLATTTAVNNVRASIVSGGLTWDNVTLPLYVAHRGMEGSYPENTMVAFVEAVNSGALAVEGDAYKLADGEVACMHDSSTGRTCRDSLGAAINVTLATANVSDIYGLDASYLSDTNTGFYGSDFRFNAPPLFRDVLAQVGSKALLFWEAKGTNTTEEVATANAIKPLIKAALKDRSVLLYSKTDLLGVSGYDPMGIPHAFWNGTGAQMTSSQLDAAVSKGYYAVMAQFANITADYKTLVNGKGLKLIGYTYERPDQLTVVPDIAICVDIATVQNKRTALGRDYLQRKYLGPGYIRPGWGGATNNGTAPIVYPVIRDIVTTNIGTVRAFGWPTEHPTTPSTGRSKIAIGNLPIDSDANGTYQIDFDLIWTDLGTDSNQLSTFFFELSKAATIDEGASNSVNLTGYMVGVRANGGYGIYKYSGPSASGAALVTGTATTNNPPTVNRAYACRIVVTPADITFTFDVNGTPATLTSTDTAYRGGKYLMLERRGHGIMVANLRTS